MATLFRAAIPQLAESRCSAASFFSNRVAIGNASDTNFWVASGKQVFAVACAAPSASGVDPDASKAAPTPTTITASSTVIDEAQSEIQSLWYAAESSAPESAGYLYSTDAKGRVSIKKVSADGTVELSAQASPAKLNVDAGFVGVSASAVAPTEVRIFLISCCVFCKIRRGMRETTLIPALSLFVLCNISLLLPVLPIDH